MSFLVSLIVAIGAFLALRRLAREERDFREVVVQRGLRVVAFVVLLASTFAALAHCIRVVPAGNVGVVDFFGTVDPRSRLAGLQWVNPLARLIPMSIKTQELKETMEVPTREGLSLSLEVSVLFHLDPTKAPEVYRTVGTNYVEVILVPQFRSVARGVTASSEARALYTSVREQLAEQIASGLRQQVEQRGIVVEATPLRKIVLPQRLAQAIEEKLSAEQESQRMEFVLLREAKEAERKRIEAQGIADFQRIVSQGISDQLLRWKGIEATMEIAKSPNSKVVVVGAGKDGLPLILGGQ